VAKLYVRVPAPPVAAALPVYAALYVAAAGIVPEKVMAGAAAMVRVSAGVVAVNAFGVPESVTLNVKV
jgi:hypothetical protein